MQEEEWLIVGKICSSDSMTRYSVKAGLSYHKRDVDSPDEVYLRVASWLLWHKHKRFGVEGVNLGAVLQESYIFPWPVFSGRGKGEREKTSVSWSRCRLFWVHVRRANTIPDAGWLSFNRCLLFLSVCTAEFSNPGPEEPVPWMF